MSNKELCIQLLDNVPTYKMGYVLAYLQGLTADEEADDIFCEQMFANYEADPDKGEYMTLDDCKREWGLA